MKAAENGSTSAQNAVGYFYVHGLGVEQDYEEAFKWYMKAAEQGNKTAIGNIGWCYENGVGVEKDPEEAQRWYDMAK